MKKYIFLLAFIFLFINLIKAQDTLRLPLNLTLFNNATKLPGSGYIGLLNLPLHPGISIGTELQLNKNPKRQIFQTATLAYFYHRYMQHGIQLYTETGYRYCFKIRLTLEARLGLGYLHSIPATGVYKLYDDGNYEKASSFGRPQFILPSFSFSIAHRLRGTNVSAFFTYQVWMQMPFVKQYVPLLPNTSVHIGARVPLKFVKTKK